MATEPILIATPMTQQPVEWAFTARIWTAQRQAALLRPDLSEEIVTIFSQIEAALRGKPAAGTRALA